MTGASGHALLSGILQQLKQIPGWRINLLQMPELLTTEKFRELMSSGIQGLIASEIPDEPILHKALRDSSLPLVLMSTPNKNTRQLARKISFVHPDETSIGRKGAKYLSSLGHFNAYGFAQLFNGLPWSDLRYRGFREQIRKSQNRTFHFRHDNTPYPERRAIPESTRSALANWLKNLPKPAAVMADMDFWGATIIDTCQSCGLSIPTQVSVIGVDNDRLLCDFSTPTLSSIEVNHEDVGSTAVIELQRLILSGPRTKGCEIRIDKAEIFQRESSQFIAPAARLIQSALDYIDEHARENISVEDVVAHLRVSRTLVALRFRQMLGTSILSKITQRRLEEVKRLLLQSGENIQDISRLCGFDNPKHLKWLFKKHTGVSMRTYRSQHLGK